MALLFSLEKILDRGFSDIPENVHISSDIILLEPLRPIQKFLYRCDKIFHVESLLPLYESNAPKNGLILITGDQTSFYMIQGDYITLLKRFNVDLPKRHDRGGQSQNRLARLRTEAIHNYITKINEYIIKFYISPEKCMPIIEHLILAGPGDKKREVQERLDYKLVPLVKMITCQEHDDIKIIVNNVLFELKNNKPLEEWEQHLMAGRAVYGHKEIEQALKDGLLEKLLIVKEKITPLIKELCLKKGVKLIPLEEGNQFGQVLGITWFVNKE